MVVEVEGSDQSNASKAAGPFEVKCVEKGAHNAIDTEFLQELREEFARLSTVTDFNRTGAQVKPLYASKDKIVCEMVVGPENINAKGTLHGGQTASLTDIVTARALGLTIRDNPMASIEISVSYFLPVKLGDVVEITAHVLKVGRNVAFTEAEFRRKSDGKLTAKGRHTVAILPKPPQSDGVKVAQY
ncbi:Esterase [Trichostrongylus colubriformis]|uniref:Acyl-coenzyme A thioesterase 13 n=1 Tax=Trichostrongylus colubriformis TaxID=6319 RepID=A0AAN8IVH6_TRICO